MGLFFVFYYPSYIPYLNNFNIKHPIILYPDYLMSFIIYVSLVCTAFFLLPATICDGHAFLIINFLIFWVHI